MNTGACLISYQTFGLSESVLSIQTGSSSLQISGRDISHNLLPNFLNWRWQGLNLAPSGCQSDVLHWATAPSQHLVPWDPLSRNARDSYWEDALQLTQTSGLSLKLNIRFPLCSSSSSHTKAHRDLCKSHEIQWDSYPSCSAQDCSLYACALLPFRRAQQFISDLTYRHLKVEEHLRGVVDLHQLQDSELELQSIYIYLSAGTITTVQVMLTLKVPVLDAEE